MSKVQGKFKRVAPQLTYNKKGPGAPKFSNFLITLNTNVRVSANVGDEMIDPLYSAAEWLFGDADQLQDVVEFGTKGDRDPVTQKTAFLPSDKTWNTRTIDTFRTTAKVEIGHNLKGARLHLHVALKIKHRAFIRLKADVIKSKINDFLEASSYTLPIRHVHVVGKPLTAEDYLDFADEDES